MDHSPAEILRALLIVLGLANTPVNPNPPGTWPVYDNNEPDHPDEVITVYDTNASLPGGREMIGGTYRPVFGFQVRVRSRSQTTGWKKADAISTALAERVYANVVTISGKSYLVNAAVGLGAVLPLGTDAPNSKRFLWTLNGNLVVTEV